MQWPVKLLILIFACCASFVLLLYATGIKEVKAGGFKRSFSQIVPQQQENIDLHAKGYYIAGSAGDEVYLGHLLSPFRALIVRNDSFKLKEIDRNDHAITASTLMVDSPFFYLADIVNYTIYRGELRSLRLDTLVFGGSFFSEAVMIGENSVFRRTFSQNAYEYTLSKESRDTVIDNDNLLQKQIDGLFCTDGMLHYDGRNRIVYVYFYRNEFFCTDTTLSLLFRGRTIDTTAHTAIEVGHIKSKNVITLASPPFIVNRRSCVDGDRLYINSQIRSDNEDPDTFKKSSVIDVYDLGQMGRYLFSFRIPHHEDKEMKSFLVRGQYLYSVHGRFLVKHRIPF